MRTIFPLLLFASLANLGTVGTLLAAEPKAATGSSATGHVAIVFDHPEKFTDAIGAYYGSERGREEVLGQIREFLVERASERLQAGQTLVMTFTDIDLAGEYEPWPGMQVEPYIRVVKGIYPPRFKFTYKLTDASRKTIKEGAVDLLEPAFMWSLSRNGGSSFHYEKDVLEAWLRSILPKKK